MSRPYSRQFYQERRRPVDPFFAKAYVLYLPIVMVITQAGLARFGCEKALSECRVSQVIVEL